MAVDQAYAGWALTDEILRMATKTAPVSRDRSRPACSPRRTSATIQVTTAAQASGAWFGSTAYQGAFEKLWGV